MKLLFDQNLSPKLINRWAIEFPGSVHVITIAMDATPDPILWAQAVGGRVTIDAFRMLCFYLQGWADDDELLNFLSKLREREA